jgi:shikimate kinase
MVVYLIGFMGSGKSTAGKRLANRLSWEFRDLDSEIEDRTGMSVPEIFDIHGEDYFRKEEADALRALDISSDLVVACGGGTPCFHENMDHMNQTGLTIYLKMDPVSLKNRLTNARKKRPLVEGLDEEELEEYLKGLLAEREPYYLLSKVIVDGLSLDTDRLVNIIP